MAGYKQEMKLREYFETLDPDNRRILYAAGIEDPAAEEQVQFAFVNFLLGERGMTPAQIEALIHGEAEEKKQLGKAFLVSLAAHPVRTVNDSVSAEEIRKNTVWLGTMTEKAMQAVRDTGAADRTDAFAEDYLSCFYPQVIRWSKPGEYPEVDNYYGVERRSAFAEGYGGVQAFEADLDLESAVTRKLVTDPEAVYEQHVKRVSDVVNGINGIHNPELYQIAVTQKTVLNDLEWNEQAVEEGARHFDRIFAPLLKEEQKQHPTATMEDIVAGFRFDDGLILRGVQEQVREGLIPADKAQQYAKSVILHYLVHGLDTTVNMVKGEAYGSHIGVEDRHTLDYAPISRDERAENRIDNRRGFIGEHYKELFKNNPLVEDDARKMQEDLSKQQEKWQAQWQEELLRRPIEERERQERLLAEKREKEMAEEAKRSVPAGEKAISDRAAFEDAYDWNRAITARVSFNSFFGRDDEKETIYQDVKKRLAPGGFDIADLSEARIHLIVYALGEKGMTLDALMAMPEEQKRALKEEFLKDVAAHPVREVNGKLPTREQVTENIRWYAQMEKKAANALRREDFVIPDPKSVNGVRAAYGTLGEKRYLVSMLADRLSNGTPGYWGRTGKKKNRPTARGLNISELYKSAYGPSRSDNNAYSFLWKRWTRS